MVYSPMQLSCFANSRASCRRGSGGFASAIGSEILVPDSKYAKPYLSALVSEIRISPAEAAAKGRHADMAATVSGWRPGHPRIGGAEARIKLAPPAGIEPTSET